MLEKELDGIESKISGLHNEQSDATKSYIEVGEIQDKIDQLDLKKDQLELMLLANGNS